MNRKRLGKLREELQSFRRRGSIRSEELESVARALGRELHSRGKEPTWVNRQFPELRPLSIPHHSHELRRGTARSIIDDLELDIDRWEQELQSAGEEEE